MHKLHALVLTGIAIAGVLSSSGCYRYYCCGPLGGTIIFAKGTDTITRFCPYCRSPTVLNDTLNYYTALGYTYTENLQAYIYPGSYSVKGPQARKLEHEGERCYESHDIYCN